MSFSDYFNVKHILCVVVGIYHCTCVKFPILIGHLWTVTTDDVLLLDGFIGFFFFGIDNYIRCTQWSKLHRTKEIIISTNIYKTLLPILYKIEWWMDSENVYFFSYITVYLLIKRTVFRDSGFFRFDRVNETKGWTNLSRISYNFFVYSIWERP